MVGIVFALEIRRRKEKMGDDEMGWIFSKEYTDRERAVFLLIFKTEVMDRRDYISSVNIYTYIQLFLFEDQQIGL